MAFSVGFAKADEEEAHFQATLVWGTNDPQPKDARLKPVDEDVADKLGKLPFKWSHYYAVGDCKDFTVEQGRQKEVSMSEDCQILVRAMKNDTVELDLRGKGKMVGKVTQKLPEKHMLVTGGDAENLTSWFVVLRRMPQ